MTGLPPPDFEGDTDRWENGTLKRPVTQLLPGDLVGLMGDPHADPKADPVTGQGNPAFIGQWSTVAGVWETGMGAHVIVAFFEHEAVTFPRDHVLRACDDQTAEERRAFTAPL